MTIVKNFEPKTLRKYIFLKYKFNVISLKLIGMAKSFRQFFWSENVCIMKIAKHS